MSDNKINVSEKMDQKTMDEIKSQVEKAGPKSKVPSLILNPSLHHASSDGGTNNPQNTPMSTGDDKIFELNINKMNKMNSVTEQ